MQAIDYDLIKPFALKEMFPLKKKGLEQIKNSRKVIKDILTGTDQRLLVILGPCSIHDVNAAFDYAIKLQHIRSIFENELFFVMRAYFEKPRTRLGWKGLISSPFLNDSIDFNYGLKLARKFLIDLNNLGLPAGTEFLDTLIVPHYFSDLISWCAVGARTVESQSHRELASGLSMAVGFKNNMEGNIQAAIDAIQVAHISHHFVTISEEGSPVVCSTLGNPDTHIILRGSHHGPNYEPSFIKEAALLLKKSNLNPAIVVDCSHGNSLKNFRKQAVVIDNLVAQLAEGSFYVRGVMLESFLQEGKQNIHEPLTYGKSITDGCVGWEDTLVLLEKLAMAVRNRRKHFISK